jgi:hypothetical protein
VTQASGFGNRQLFKRSINKNQIFKIRQNFCSGDLGLLVISDTFSPQHLRAGFQITPVSQ